MKHSFVTPKMLAVGGIVLFAAFMRLIPHYPNFTPIAAIALFGGAHFSKKWLAYLVPLFALFVSDLLIGFHNFMIPVYVSFALVVALGGLLKGRISLLSVPLAGIASATLFFLLTNFAVWIGSPYYAQNMGGLIACYTAAIPFYHTQLLGDLFYSSVFFGGFYLLGQRYPVLKQA